MAKIKYGDLFQIKTSKGLAYFQCVKETSATECEVIRILPGVFESTDNINLNALIELKEVFFVQFPLKYALKQNVIKLIGNYPVPKDVQLPKFYRDKHIVKNEFVSWHIINSDTLHIRSVKELSEDEKKLSPAGIWNDTLLAERIAEGWKPEDWV